LSSSEPSAVRIRPAREVTKGVTTMGRLANKNILITGGNSGIGLAAAQEFDREGARVAICGLNEGSLQAAKKTLAAGSLAVRAEGVADNLDRLDLQGRGRPSRSNPQRRTRGPRDSREFPKPRPDGHGDVRSLPRARAGRGG